MEYVFGYGSLSALLTVKPTRTPDPRGYVTDVHGRRRWGVATDNRVTIPGYKRYRAADGSYPAVHVAFLDLVAGEGTVNGVCLPVSPGRLAVLDLRERNYVRTDVTEQLAHALGRTWAYVGSEEGRARLAAGRAGETAVVTREYLDTVLDGFSRLGERELGRFHASSDLAGLPIRELERVDLAGDPAPRAK